MAKERLSKLQQAILEVLSDGNYWEYSEVREATGKKLGRWVEWNEQMNKWDYYDRQNSFYVSFSRSMTNLRKKGLVEGHIWCGRDDYIPTDTPNNQECNTRIKITERGLIVNVYHH